MLVNSNSVGHSGASQWNYGISREVGHLCKSVTLFQSLGHRIRAGLGGLFLSLGWVKHSMGQAWRDLDSSLHEERKS